jgi:hypothetical protein
MQTNKICFIGNAGSGKSTLSAEVYVRLKKQHKNAELVTEFVRSDIQINGPMSNIWEQYRTRSNQEQLENVIPKNVEYMVTDSGVLTPYFYASLYADNTDARQRIVLADMYRFLINDLFLKRYTHVFFIPMAETYASNPNMLSDGTRYQTPEQIQTLENHMSLIFTAIHRVDNVHVLDGPIDERCDRVMQIIS